MTFMVCLVACRVACVAEIFAGPLKSFLSEPSADRRQSNHHFLLLLGAALAWKPATADGPGSRLFGAGGKYQG